MADIDSQTTSHRMSTASEEFRDKITTFTSNAPSELSDIEAQFHILPVPHRMPTHQTVNQCGDGAPLETSLSLLSVPAQPGIPNGGPTAWLQVACGFVMFLNSWGLVNAFGVWQSYYSTTLLPTRSNSDISWIGSVQAFLLCCTTIFAGPLFDRGHGLMLIRLGSFMVVFGLMATSLCYTYWQLMLAQGICVGAGSGALFITSVSILPWYFTTKRAFAIGVAASGSSLGGVIYPIVFHHMQPQVGFGWATRIIGFMAMGTLLFPCCGGLRIRALPPPRRKVVDFSGFRELPFCFFCSAAFIGFTGLYVPFFYIAEFASSQANFSPTLAFYMLPVLSSGSIVGRLLPSLMADHFGIINVLGICTFVAGILGFAWNAVNNSLAGLVIWALLYGAFSGAFVSLQPSTVISITDDVSVIGGRLGMNTFCAALGILIGNPVAGVIINNGGWIGLHALCGGTLLLGSFLIFLTRWFVVGKQLIRKA